MPLVYKELRRQASHYLRRERQGHTLQTTALIHEAYLKLLGQNQVEWQNRAHFFAIASTPMRRILVDYARERHRVKRGKSGFGRSVSDFCERKIRRFNCFGQSPKSFGKI